MTDEVERSALVGEGGRRSMLGGNVVSRHYLALAMQSDDAVRWGEIGDEWCDGVGSIV